MKRITLACRVIAPFLFVLAFAVVVWHRNSNGLASRRLTLASVNADIDVTGVGGLRTRIGVKNSSTRKLELQSLSAEMGCRADVRASGLPMVFEPSELRFFDLHIAADASVLCPVTDRSCGNTLRLHPIIRSAKGERLLAHAWEVPAEIKRPIVASLSRIRLESGGVASNDSRSSMRVQIEAKEGSRFTGFDLVGQTRGVTLETVPGSSADTAVTCLLRGNLNCKVGEAVCQLKVNAEDGNGQGCELYIPIDIEPLR